MTEGGPRRRPADRDIATDPRPLVRVLGHGAERTGPPIYLLRLLRWWDRHPPAFDLQVVVGRPGPLVPEYHRVADTVVARLDRRSPERLADRALTAVGAGTAGQTVVRASTRRRTAAGRPADVTVVNGATAATAALLDALEPTGPVAVIAHELSTGWQHNIDRPARDRLLQADRFLAVSRCVERYLIDELGVAAEAVTVIHPMVEAARDGDDIPRPAPRGGDACITVGGGGVTDWRKAPELWLRLAHEVGRLAPGRDHRFVWFGGDAPESDAFWPLAHEIRHLELGDRVRFLGEVDNPAAVLADHDVFVSTAREDAYPLVCIEAASLGIPVVAFDGGGAAELIAESGCGVVVPYPDVDSMAHRLIELTADHGRRQLLGERGRAFAREHLDVAVIAPRVARWILPEAA